MSFIPAFFNRNSSGALLIENVVLAQLAKEFGTPLYVYSQASITAAFGAWQAALKGRKAHIHYALKANSNLSIVQSLVAQGAGCDIVSGGEMARALAAGCKPENIVFSGVGKSTLEINEALRLGVGMFNIESAAELERLAACAAALGKVANISLRVNPDVDPKTHPYISTGLKENKFGVAFDEALAVYQRAAQLPSIRIAGIDCHIGSQITEGAPYLDALDKILDLVEGLEAQGIHIECLDLGGGLGIQYQDAIPPTPAELLAPMLAKIDARGHAHRSLAFEPGRSIVGNAGVLISSVEYLKPTAAKNFAIVDAAMNDLMRPALYQAYHAMAEVQLNAATPKGAWDIVGPVCESGDWLGKNRELQLAAGDLIAIFSAGAYGAGIASNYNTRPRAAEILVSGDTYRLIKPRETVDALLAAEKALLR